MLSTCTEYSPLLTTIFRADMAGVDEQTVGFPIEILVNAVDPKYLCGLCQRLMREPIQGYCGHRFCRVCITTRINREPSGTLTCPLCVEEASDEVACLSLAEVFPDNGLRRDLKKLPVKCVQSGCPWEGVFSRYDQHLKVCNSAMVKCVCGGSIPPDALDQHDLDECPARRTACPYCKQAAHASDTETHMLACESRPASEDADADAARQLTLCPFGCTTTMTSQDDQMQHYITSHVKHTSSLLRLLKLKPDDQTEPGSGREPAGAMPVQAAATPEFMSSLSTLSDRVAVLVDQVNQDEESISQLKQLQQTREQNLDNAESKIKSLERIVTMKDIQIAELSLKVQVLEATSYDGRLVWRVGEISRKRQDAASGRTTSIYSPSFCTSRTGYKMCARLYLNGDGTGKTTHVSIFLVLLRGHYDALLSWPFRQKVTFRLIDINNRANDVVDAFRPDLNSSSFARPSSEMNIASGCPLFVPLGRLDDPRQGYVVDDTAFFTITADVTGLAEVTL